MTKSSGLIIRTTPGIIMPEVFLKKAIGKYTTALASSAFIADNPAGQQLVPSFTSTIPSVEDFLKLLEDQKDIETLIHFQQADELTDESQQPFYICMTKDEKPAVIAFIEGDFAGVKGEKHTGEMYAALKISKYFGKPWKLLDGDIARFEEEILNDGDTQEYIDGLCGDRGVVVFHTTAGNIFTFEKGADTSVKYEWGWVSDSTGYEEKSSKDAVAEQDAKAEERHEKIRGGLLSKIKESKAATVEVPPVVPINVKVDKTASTAIDPKECIGAPPDLIKEKNGNKIDGWYNKWTTGMSMDGKPLTRQQRLAGSLAVMNDAWKSRKDYRPLAEGLATAKEQLAGSNGRPAGYRGFAPLITPTMKGIIKSFLATGDAVAVVEGAKLIKPADLKSPGDIGTFSKEQEYPFDNVLRWDPDLFGNFLRKCADEKDFGPAVLLYHEMQNAILLERLTNPKKEEETVTVPEPEPEPVAKTEPKKEPPKPTPAVTPKAKGSIASRFSK